MAEHAATRIETKDVREAFAALIRERISPERIVKAISDGLDAMETQFFAEKGVVKDQRDVIAWNERRQYAQLAAEYGGYHIAKKASEGEGSGRVILILPEGPATIPPAPERTVQIPNGPILILPNQQKEGRNV